MTESVRHGPIRTVEKLWGTETWFVNTELYCYKRLRILAGKCSSKHFHKVKDETFCVVAGTVSVELEGTVLVLGRGDSIRIKPRQIHRFWGDGIVEEISTHHSDEDVVRLEESKNL